MLSSPGRYVALLLLSATIALPLRSQEKPAAKPSTSKKTNGTEKKAAPAATSSSEPKKTIDLKKMDLSALPADAILVICERAGEALDLVPKAVILRPDKYQEMRDEIDRLRKQLQTEKPATPTRCVLRGRVEAGAVRLEAEFAGTAEHADTLVALACPQAGAASAETDGRMARIRRLESSGFQVRIEKAGEYHVKLDLLLPLAAREGNGRGFELTLPRPVITQLELDLPAHVKDLRVGGRSLDDPQLRGLKWSDNRHLSGNPGLGPVEKLDLAWKEVRPPMGEPVRTAEGHIQARLDAAGLTTEADLWLKVEGAPTDVWRLLVPLKADIKVLAKEPGASPPPLAKPLETADQKFASLRTLHLKEASSEPLHVQVKVPLRLRDSSLLPIGPFCVLDAVRQTGTVTVRNQVRNLHLDYRGHGDMQLRRQQTEENGDTPATVATLVYSNIPSIEKPKEAAGPNSLSWLDLAAETVHVRVRTRVTHTLTLRPDAGRDTRHWEVVTTITPAMKWSEGEQLKILVPPEWKSTDDSAAVIPSGNPPCVTIPSSLLREAPTQAQHLEGRLEATYPAAGRAVLKLPRPQGTVESCEIKIEAPADSEVILHNGEQANLELSKQTRPNEQTWRWRAGAALPAGEPALDVSWRPYRPELRVLSVVDLTMNGARGDVRQELRLQVPPAPPAFVDLHMPPSLGDSLDIEDERGQRVRGASDAPPRTIRLPVPAKASGTEWRLILRYTTRLGDKERGPRAGVPFAVPLVTPEQATGGEVKVRVWSEPGLLPRAAAGPHWEEQSIEEVKGRSDLPVLVLHATRLDAPLLLAVREQAAGFSVLVERALLRVQLLEGGVQNWRARYQLRQLAERDLDILFPAPVATLTAQFLLNRRTVAVDIVNERGEPSDGGNIARLHLSPELIRRSALLEVSFQALPGRAGRSLLHTILQPPEILGAPALPARWQVSVPANRVLLAPESAAGVERTWTRRGWLLAARLQRSAADGEREADESPPVERRHESEPALLCWQDRTAPIVLTHAPQQGWLLACSLGLLSIGLALYWAARPHSGSGGRMAVWFWPLLALLTLAIAIAALLWPTMLSAVVYGCEPGIIVLLGVLGLQWLMHQRYRRQIVFLPSFSRSRAGSSLVRKTSPPRPQTGEPSTVDAPPPSLSS